jgi:gliding motility-associated-like protein
MKKLVLLILLFFIFNISAQKEANFWYFGENAGIDFSTNPPNIITGSLSTDEGSASISNADGILQLYTDGSAVFDRTGAIMDNGTGLLGNSSSAQSAIIVPKPKDANIYYVFTVGNQQFGGAGNGVMFSIVDMTLNNGLGAITSKNNALNNSENTREKITSVRGDACNTFWVITADSNNFYAYLIDENGVQNSAITSTTDNNLSNLRGYLKISPDGKTLVNASASSGTYIFDFNAATGEISNGGSINGITNGGYGAEFSRNGKKLYISSGTYSQINPTTGTRNPPEYASITQFNLESRNITDINSSAALIHETDAGYRGALQLASNGKIYYARSKTSWLGVINSPEKEATEINFIEDGLSLNGQISTEGLPPFIQSFFLEIDITDNDTNTVVNSQDLEFCAGQNKIIESDPVLGTNVTYEWTFDDGTTTSVVDRNKDLTLNNMIASDSGKYTLLVQLTDICTNVINFEATFNLKVNPLPELNAILVYKQCDFDNDPNDFIANFNLTTLESKIYSGSDPVTIDFFETADTSFSFPLTKNDYRNSTSTSPINGNHTLVVRVTNDVTNCAIKLEIELKVNPSGIDSYPDIYTCELDLNEKIPNSRNSIGSGNSFYNLDNKTTDIIANSYSSLDKDTHDFSYFRTREDATLQRNEIVAPYEGELFNSGAILFVRISLKDSNACENVGQFKIIIQERPMPKGSADAYLLCLNNPINFPQLITIDLDANTGVSGDTYTWYLNGNLLSTETDAILKANKKGEYRVVTSRSYMNNITNPSDDFACTGYNMFTVSESNVASIETFSFVENQNNPANNTFTVIAVGDGDYEFALRNDDKNTTTLFQYEPIFENIEGGIYTIIVKDRNGCLPYATLQVSALQFPKFFTPNGDGRNDTWTIKGANNTFYSKSSIRIFNRYGNLVAEPTLDGIGWDGTNNGRILSSDDYWYNIILTPADPSKPTINKIGNFSLLRR